MSKARLTDAGPGAGCRGPILYSFVSLWIVAVAFLVQASAWLAEQFSLIQEQPLSSWTWPVATWLEVVLLGVPVLLGGLVSRAPAYRTVYRAWLIALCLVAVLALARFVPREATQTAAAARILLAGLCVLGLAALARRNPRPVDTGGQFGGPIADPGPKVGMGLMLLGFAAVPVVVAPWLAIGALGSPLDAALDLAAGFSLGFLASYLVGRWLLRPSDREQQLGSFAFRGFAVGVTLLLLSSGFGSSGSQLLLMGGLPALGFAVAALTPLTRLTAHRWLPAFILLGGAAAAILAFVDPTEVTLLLAGDDLPEWAARAAVLMIVLGWFTGIALFRAGLRFVPSEALAPVKPFSVAAVALWLAGLVLYFVVGQPGFYGEQLFVILRDQADVAQATSIAERGDRAEYVYRTLTKEAARSQAPLRAELDRRGVEYRPYYLVNALEVNGGPLLRNELAQRSEVDRVLGSTHLRPLPAPQPASRGGEPAPQEVQWNLSSIGADRVWKELGAEGRGIVVGQSDSGVDGDHPALRDGYRGRNGENDYNWLDPWNGTKGPVDAAGHGTHTLGLVLGRGGIGVAPGAEWLGCVNLARGIGNPAVYLNCMQFMLAPYPQGSDPFEDGVPRRGAQVTNNSWGCPPLEGCDANTLLAATRALRAAGIFVAASAGNSGPRCGSLADPIAIYQEAFAVGAADKDGNVAFFSSRGPVTADGSNRIKPDLLAPGWDVVSAFPGGTYQTESGTSMAGPHVAGVVALMWSAQPKLVGDVANTERILEETARPYEGRREGCFAGTVPNAAYGYGLVDAYAAVKAALEIK